MSDRRLTALRAFAKQDVSPRERDIARARLQAAGVGWGDPPSPPAPAAALPAPEPWDFNASVTVNGGTASVNFYWRVSGT